MSGRAASNAARARAHTASLTLALCVVASSLADDLALEVRAAIAPPIAAFAGYQAGLLSGGALRKFFDEVLPHAELAAGPIAEALAQTRAHPRELLRPALEGCLGELARRLDAALVSRATSIRRERDALRARVYEPLAVLHDVLQELVDARA